MTIELDVTTMVSSGVGAAVGILVLWAVIAVTQRLVRGY